MIVAGGKRVKTGRGGNEDDVLRFGHIVTEQISQIACAGKDVSKVQIHSRTATLAVSKGRANSHDAHHHTLSDVERSFVRLGRHAERQDSHSVPIRVRTRQCQAAEEDED